jgi:hypothetical protein
MNVLVGLDKTANPKGERNFQDRRLVESWTIESCSLHALECSPDQGKSRAVSRPAWKWF